VTSRNLARTTGLLYALNIAIGILAIVWTSRDKPTADLLNLAGAAEYAIVVILLGRLFEPATRRLSWVVAGIGLIACLVSAAMILHLVAVPPGVSPVVVFGPYCIGLGAVMARSGMMPRLLGLLLVAAGVSWLTFALPALAHRLAPWNTVVGAVPELLLTLWLLVVGVKAARQD